MSLLGTTEMAKFNEKTSVSLEDVMQAKGGAVNLLRGNQMGPYVFPGIPPEYTNWRDEQRSWKESVAMLELSYHMTELHLRGREIIPFLAQLAVNKFDPFQVKRAKQLVLASHDGNLIGDEILFREEEEFFRVVGGPMANDWLLYNAANSSFDVTAEMHQNWMVRQVPREVFRFQLQGPHALALLTKVSDGTLPDIKFFYIGEFKIAGKTVRALRHGMAGTPGFEIYGPWDDQHVVREAVERAGEEFQLRKVGEMAYGPTAQESGWISMPVPAIYHGAEMKSYRESLSAHHLESAASLGGSFVSDNIADYYVDPIEVGYGGLIDFSRDFIGREALLERSKAPKRKKVTLVWNDEDAIAVQRAALFDNPPARFINMPHAPYATFMADSVRIDGAHVGVSMQSSFSSNARAFLSNALVDVAHSEPGTQVTLLWGEPDSQRRSVEKHVVREIRAVVAPAPFFEKSNKIDRK